MPRLIAMLAGALKTHWFGTVTAMLGSLVFFWASLHEAEIRDAFPFYWGPYTGVVSTQALFFWSGVIVVSAMLAWKNKVDEGARQDLVDATKRVSTLVQTLPPRAWREDYAASASAVADSLDAVLPRSSVADSTLDEIQRVIVVILNAIASLAFRYDAQPRTSAGESALYAANVMLFVPRRPSAPFFDDALMSVLRFVPPDTSVEHLLGVLQLVPSLTYSTAENGRDTTVPSIVLPVPSISKATNGKWRVLPGAPLAFVGDGVDGYADATSISRWFDEAADFPGSVRDQVAEYFAGPGAASRSFVSRRLMSGEEKLGVLNLHSNLPNLLGVREGGTAEASVARREEFFALLTPLLRELECSVRTYRSRGGV